MKVLYVSDLDGTLLNKNQELDLYTAQKINELIDKGVNFTISTGRGDSVRTIMKDIHFQMPVMLLNGTVCYDFEQKKYVNAQSIPNEKVIEIMDKLNNFNYKTFEIQTIMDGKLTRFAISKWNRKSDCLAINLLISGENVSAIRQILKGLTGINFFINPKVYADNEYFCDIVLENVSKSSSLKEFKEKYKFDKVIAFGDSENDLPLLEASDEFYAVANAADIVKQRATAIIGSCLENGVVNFIEEVEK